MRDRHILEDDTGLLILGVKVLDGLEVEKVQLVHRRAKRHDRPRVRGSGGHAASAPGRSTAAAITHAMTPFFFFLNIVQHQLR